MSDNLTEARPGEQARQLLPGLLLTLAFAAISFATWWFLRNTWVNFSALLWAFVYSIVATNLIPKLSRGRFAPGIGFCSTRLLRISIALLGLTVSALVWVRLGGAGVAAVLLNLIVVFTFGFVFCQYVLRLGGSLSILIGVGTAVCGASAIAATGPAIKAKDEEMGLSIAVITLFGLLATFGYPLLFHGPLGQWLGNSPLAFGMWSAMGIHETAQVIAAGSQVEGALSMAISGKFIRIFMIGPMVFVSRFIFRRFSASTSAERATLSVPWFAVIFIIFTLVHLGLESLPIGDYWLWLNSTYIKPAVTFLLAWSFAAIGFKVKISDIWSIGIKSFLGGMVVSLVAGITALLLAKALYMYF